MAPFDLPAKRVEKVTFSISDTVHTINYYNFTIKILPFPRDSLPAKVLELQKKLELEKKKIYNVNLDYFDIG